MTALELAALEDEERLGERAVIGEWLAQYAGACTCGSPLRLGFPHEPGCGWEPIARIDPTAPEPPLTPEDLEEIAAVGHGPHGCGAPVWSVYGGPPDQCALFDGHLSPCTP